MCLADSDILECSECAQLSRKSARNQVVSNVNFGGFPSSKLPKLARHVCREQVVVHQKLICIPQLANLSRDGTAELVV